jgi:hypothetical protein
MHVERASPRRFTLGLLVGLLGITRVTPFDYTFELSVRSSLVRQLTPHRRCPEAVLGESDPECDDQCLRYDPFWRGVWRVDFFRVCLHLDFLLGLTRGDSFVRGHNVGDPSPTTVGVTA